MLHDLVDVDDTVVDAWYLLSMAKLAGDELEEAADVPYFSVSYRILSHCQSMHYRCCTIW